MRDVSCQIENKYSVGYPVILALFSYFINNNLLLLVLPNLFLGLINIHLVCKLFGWTTGFYFIFLNVSLIQRNYLGGSEPLYLMLTLTSFIGVKNIYYLNALNVLSFSTRVIGLINIISTTLYVFINNKLSNKIKYLLFLSIIFISIVYITSIINGAEYFSVHDAYNRDRYSQAYLNYPFFSFVYAFNENNRLLMLVKFLSYFLLCLSTFYYIFKNIINKIIKNYDLFYIFYALFLFTYNSSWAYIEFVRFYGPIMPISLFYISRYLPKKIFLRYFFLIIFTSISALGVTGFFLRLF